MAQTKAKESQLEFVPLVKYVIGAAGSPAYQNGWTFYGNPWGQAGNYFIKSREGLVSLVIMTRNGSTNTTIFTLPPGFRPSVQISGSGRDASGAVLLDIGADGQVRTEAGASNTWLAFSITFLAEQ